MSSYERRLDLLEELRANIDAAASAEFVRWIREQYDDAFRGERHQLTLQLEWNEVARAYEIRLSKADVA